MGSQDDKSGIRFRLKNEQNAFQIAAVWISAATHFQFFRFFQPAEPSPTDLHPTFRAEIVCRLSSFSANAVGKSVLLGESHCVRFGILRLRRISTPCQLPMETDRLISSGKSSPDPPASGLGRAIAFSVFARVWQVCTGPVTQILLMAFLLPAARDYYYAFSSLLGMQVLIELGLHVVIINMASHEWAGLSLLNGQLHGQQSSRNRLISLGRRMGQWYRLAAMVFLVVLLPSGLFFFSGQPATDSASASTLRATVDWQYPWLALVCITAAQLTQLPWLSVLEGCHQVEMLNRTRFWQAVTGTAAVWICLVTDCGLWTLVLSAAVRLAGDLWLIYGHYGKFFREFEQDVATDQQVDWRHEILPLQWRIAVQGIMLWLAIQLPLLFVFRKQPEGDAARLGMTWSILTAAQGAALAWVETRRPLFGSLIAERQFATLDRIFFRSARISIALMALAATGLIAVIWFAETSSHPLGKMLSAGLLPVRAAAVLAFGFVANQPGLCANLYVRAHKRDPFLVASVTSNLTTACAQLALGWVYGVDGIAAGYAAAVALVQTPLLLQVWWRTRRDWH